MLTEIALDVNSCICNLENGQPFIFFRFCSKTRYMPVQYFYRAVMDYKVVQLFSFRSHKLLSKN